MGTFTLIAKRFNWLHELYELVILYVTFICLSQSWSRGWFEYYIIPFWETLQWKIQFTLFDKTPKSGAFQQNSLDYPETHLKNIKVIIANSIFLWSESKVISGWNTKTIGSPYKPWSLSFCSFTWKTNIFHLSDLKFEFHPFVSFNYNIRPGINL